MDLVFHRADGGTLGFVERLHEITYPHMAQLKNHVQMFGKSILYCDPVVPLWQSSIPSVRQYLQDSDQYAVTLTPDAEAWMFELFKETAPITMTLTDIKKCFASTFDGARAFCNKTAWNNGYKSIVLGENLSSKMWKLQPTICHGATIEILRPPFWKMNQWQVSFRVLNINRPDEFLNMNYRDNRTVIFEAINWYRYPLPYGKADPFPKLDWKPVPIPLLSNKDEGHLELDWISFYGYGETKIRNPRWPQV